MYVVDYNFLTARKKLLLLGAAGGPTILRRPRSYPTIKSNVKRKMKVLESEEGYFVNLFMNFL
jgi:hypothetical protein